MKIIIALVIIALFVAGCIDKGAKNDPCWKCDKNDCTDCKHWKELTGDDS